MFQFERGYIGISYDNLDKLRGVLIIFGRDEEKD